MINFYDEIFGVKKEWEDGISFHGKIILPNNNQVGVWFLTLCNKVYAYKVKHVLNLLDWEVQLSRFWAEFSSRSYIIKSTKVYLTCSLFGKLQLLIPHGNLLKFSLILRNGNLSWGNMFIIQIWYMWGETGLYLQTCDANKTWNQY